MNVEAHLWSIAEADIKARGLWLTPGCRARLHAFVRYGASVVVPVIERQPGRLAEAEENLQKFIATMAVPAFKRNDTDLHEPDFDYAQRSLCPLWPFC